MLSYISLCLPSVTLINGHSDYTGHFLCIFTSNHQVLFLSLIGLQLLSAFHSRILPPNNECSVGYPTNNIQGHYAGMLYPLLLEMDLQEIRNDPLNIDRDSLVDRLARIRGGGRGVGGNGGGGCVRRRYD